MQGKQYALGKARTINGVYFESAERALESLEDYGCLHYKVAIICGISEPRYSAAELKRLNAQNERIYDIGGKKLTGYECTQAMRKLETSVRSQKDIRETARASGDKALVKKCNERIKAYKAKYTEISNITGIPEEPRRMSKPRMPKTDNNITSPTSKVLTNSGNGGIIHSEKGLVLSTYVNSNDNLYERSKKIKPIDGFEDVVIHGDSNGFTIKDLNGNETTNYTPWQFAEILKEDPNYHGGAIRLLACDSGKGDGFPAQALANLLGVDVLAPTDKVIVYDNGEIKLGFDGRGEWKLFKKGEAK